MLVRTMLVAVTTAALLPLAGGTAHASCLDDAQARRLDEGYTEGPKSPYWFLGYVTYSGLATVAVYGDAAVSDWTSWTTEDVPEYTQVTAANTVDVTADFVDCVAG